MARGNHSMGRVSTSSSSPAIPVRPSITLPRHHGHPPIVPSPSTPPTTHRKVINIHRNCGPIWVSPMAQSVGQYWQCSAVSAGSTGEAKKGGCGRCGGNTVGAEGRCGEKEWQRTIRCVPPTTREPNAQAVQVVCKQGNGAGVEA